jgi:hypothetical protein
MDWSFKKTTTLLQSSFEFVEMFILNVHISRVEMKKKNTAQLSTGLIFTIQKHFTVYFIFIYKNVYK